MIQSMEERVGTNRWESLPEHDDRYNLTWTSTSITLWRCSQATFETLISWRHIFAFSHVSIKDHVERSKLTDCIFWWRRSEWSEAVFDVKKQSQSVWDKHYEHWILTNPYFPKNMMCRNSNRSLTYPITTFCGSIVTSCSSGRCSVRISLQSWVSLWLKLLCTWQCDTVPFELIPWICSFPSGTNYDSMMTGAELNLHVTKIWSWNCNSSPKHDIILIHIIYPHWSIWVTNTDMSSTICLKWKCHDWKVVDVSASLRQKES